MTYEHGWHRGYDDRRASRPWALTPAQETTEHGQGYTCGWAAAFREISSVIGSIRTCPDCGRPQHYTGTELGWCHDALIDMWLCNDPTNWHAEET